MKARTLVACTLLTAGLLGHDVSAEVLCQRRSGAVVVRDACRSREKAIDLSRFGATGPQGPAGPPGPAPLTECPPDSARVGTTCVDKYEASVWEIAPTNDALIAKVQSGTVTLADLTTGGATRLCSGPGSSYVPSNFPKSGQWTPAPASNPSGPGVYAASVAGVVPTTCISWFQAAQACRLSGKRLITNLEWQDAAAGTPDPGTDDNTTDCAVAGEMGALVPTGSRTSCVSGWGVFDMVGNADEWVADWADQANGCSDWTSMVSLPGSDSMCFGGSGDPGGNAVKGVPGALLRGGRFINPSPAAAANAGVFAVTSHTILAESGAGFRCVR